MNTVKKIMFMSSNDKSCGMGILKLENKNNNVFGNLKTYQGKFQGNYILGIKLSDKIIKQNVSIQNNSYNFVSTEINNLDNVMGCVLIEISKGEFKPIIWGNEKDKNYKANIINSLRQSLNNITNSKLNIQKEQTNFNIKTPIQQNQDVNYQKTPTIEKIQTPPTEETITNNFQNLEKDELDDLTNNKNPIEEFEKNELDCSNKNKNSNEDLKKDEQLNLLEIEKKQSQNKVDNCNKISLQKLSKLTTQNKLYNNENVYHPIRNANKNYDAESLSKIAITEEKIISQEVPEVAISCEQSMLFESSDDEIEKTIDNELQDSNNSSHNFYNMIADQIQELFDRYPPEENLNKIIDNSYWVKIDTDIVNKHYVVGIIKNNDDIKYICYGVPGNYNQEPPSEMKDYSQWLPVDISDPYNKGYWVMYQDADTGENIYIN